MKVQHLLIGILTSTSLFISASIKDIKAQPYFQSLVCVVNQTNNDIKVQYGWHRESEWKQVWIDAGGIYRFWHSYDYPNENRSPRFLLGVFTRNQGKLNYNVRGYSSNSKENCQEASMVYIKESSNNFYVTGDRVSTGHWDEGCRCWGRKVN